MCAQVAAEGHPGGTIGALLTFAMDDGCSQFGHSCYKHVKGTVMSTRVVPPYSNIYLASCLEAAAQSQSASTVLAQHALGYLLEYAEQQV